MNDSERAEKAKQIYDDMLKLCEILEHMQHNAFMLLSNTAALRNGQEVRVALGDFEDKIESARNWCEELTK